MSPETTGPDEWRQLLLHWAREQASDGWGVPRLVLMEPQSMLPVTMLRATKSFTGTVWTLLHMLSIVVDKEIASSREGPSLSLANTVPGSEPFDWSVFLTAETERHNARANRMTGEHGGSYGRAAGEVLLRERFFEVLRGWVDNFFGCADCKEHFLTDFDRCAYGRCDTERPVSLWLWEDHNHVTQRVARESQQEMLGLKDKPRYEDPKMQAEMVEKALTLVGGVVDGFVAWGVMIFTMDFFTHVFSAQLIVLSLLKNSWSS